MKRAVSPAMRFALTAAVFAAGLLAQQPKMIDAHVHHNGDLEFLTKLVARLDKLGGNKE